MLAILLQSSEKNRVSLGLIEGIDTLLQALALYKRRNPQVIVRSHVIRIQTSDWLLEVT